MQRQATVEAIWTFAGFPAGYEALLNATQRPLGREVMLDLAAAAGLSAGSLVLDAACYDASASLPLVERFGCRLLGVDLARQGFAARHRAAEDPTLGGRVRYAQGRLQALPVATGACDLVWCRDALSCAPCGATLRELARVVAGGGTVLLHTSCATPLLEPLERAELFEVLGLNAESMDAATVEREAELAGLRIEKRLVVGSQWLQHRLEAPPAAPVGDDLLTLARLTQWPERYAAAWGESWYRRILAWHRWPVYQALGKLEGVLWVLRPRAGRAEGAG
jgi:ubiquinone/menaquinone biosynthesis C-methylase UbiE